MLNPPTNPVGLVHFNLPPCADAPYDRDVPVRDTGTRPENQHTPRLRPMAALIMASCLPPPASGPPPQINSTDLSCIRRTLHRPMIRPNRAARPKSEAEYEAYNLPPSEMACRYLFRYVPCCDHNGPALSASSIVPSYTIAKCINGKSRPTPPTSQRPELNNQILCVFPLHLKGFHRNILRETIAGKDGQYFHALFLRPIGPMKRPDSSFAGQNNGSG